MKFSKFSLFSRNATLKIARSTNVRRIPVVNTGSCFFAVDRSNYILVETTFTGTEANDWNCVVAKLNDSGRVAFRLYDPAGSTIGTVVVLTGYAGLVTAVNSNATVSRYVKLTLAGSISNTQAFSADLNDVTFFNGGQG